MAQIIKVSIDLTKIDKSKIKPHANGGKYYELEIIVNDEKNQYGKEVSVANDRTQDERLQKVNRVYIGNGNVVWSSNATTPSVSATPTPKAEVILPSTSQDDDLPF